MVRSLIGLSMRVYRHSPLYPRLGRSMARLLSLANCFGSGKPIVRTIAGVTYELDLREVIDSSLYYSGTFESQAERIIAAAVTRGMIALDIGANIGYHTFRMARAAGPDGRVLAIEPTAWAMEKLKRNAALNSFTNIDFLKVGLSDSDLGPTEVSFQSSYRLDGTRTESRETVPILTLDTIVQQQKLARIDFVKLDVDGFEGKVLTGASETLRRCHPVLFFEISPSAMKQNGDDAERLLKRLLALGYRFQAEDGDAIADVAAFCTRIADGCSANLLAKPAA